MSIVWQPLSGRIGDWLLEQLRSGKWSEAILVSAFARVGGLRHLAAAFDAFRASGGISRAWIGVDVYGTSVEALELLMSCVEEVFIVHNPGPSTFHPKAYAFGKGDDWVLAVGSNNLTTGGLFLNVEASVIQSGGKGLIDKLQSSLSQIPSNNVRQLNTDLLRQLVEVGLVKPEEALPSSIDEPDTVNPPTNSPFSKTPIIPPPPIPKPTKPVLAAKAIGGLPESFVLLLGTRDVRQQPGYSRDVYIPIAARDAHPGFWGWPGGFEAPGMTKGTFLERRVQLQIHPIGGHASAADRRLYYYKERSEFRFNAGPLIAGAKEGDLLVVERSRQPGIEYDATIVAAGSPAYAKWLGVASEEVASGKRWGYA